MKAEDYDQYRQLGDMLRCLREIIVDGLRHGFFDYMLRCLREIIVDGLRHGFFDYTITCEMIEKRKRQLIIKAGKSYRFIIPDEDLH